MWEWVKKRYHFLLAMMWVILAAPSLVWWKESVLWVILLSLYANFESSLAANEAKKDHGKLDEALEILKRMEKS